MAEKNFLREVYGRLEGVLAKLTWALQKFRNGKVENGVKGVNEADQELRNAMQLFQFKFSGIWDRWQTMKRKRHKEQERK